MEVKINMTKWTHIYLEGFCLYNSMKNKFDKTCSLKDINSLKDLKSKNPKWTKRRNPLYRKSNKRPLWCIKKFKVKERTPSFMCLGNLGGKECPFFGCTEAEQHDKQAFDLMWALKSQRVKDYEDKKGYDKFIKKFERMLK